MEIDHLKSFHIIIRLAVDQFCIGIDARIGNNRMVQQTAAYNSIAYPTTSGKNYEILTQRVYDNYSWVAGTGTALSSSIDAANNANAHYFVTNNNAPYMPCRYAQKVRHGSFQPAQCKSAWHAGSKRLVDASSFFRKAIV